MEHGWTFDKLNGYNQFCRNPAFSSKSGFLAAFKRLNIEQNQRRANSRSESISQINNEKSRNRRQRRVSGRVHMAEDWDVYLCQIDDQPAAVFVDLGRAESAPDPRRPWLLRVQVPLQIPRPDGLSDQEETEALYELEDELFAHVAQGLRACYVGRVTSQGRRELFYYGQSAEGFEPAVEKAAARFPQYAFTSRAHEDRDWDLYSDLLYPSDLDMQSIQNRRVVDHLTAEGDNLSQPREIVHWLYFPSEHARNQLVDQMEGEGFTTEPFQTEKPDDEFSFGLRLVRRDSAALDLLDPLVADLFLRAQSCGGEYDGWESPVVK